jgi:hypothetical protein
MGKGPIGGGPGQGAIGSNHGILCKYLSHMQHFPQKRRRYILIGGDHAIMWA